MESAEVGMEGKSQLCRRPLSMSKGRVSSFSPGPVLQLHKLLNTPRAPCLLYRAAMASWAKTLLALVLDGRPSQKQGSHLGRSKKADTCSLTKA